VFWQSVLSLILAAHTTASLRHDEDVQATLLNLLLRNYFNAGLYDQADKLLSKTSFPESAGNPQLARYLFYLGRIRAIQLNYTESHTHLQHAIRRAPVETLAPGFVQTVYKYFVVVELLMGDIPERSTFRRPVLRRALAPYFQLVQGQLQSGCTGLKEPQLILAKSPDIRQPSESVISKRSKRSSRNIPPNSPSMELTRLSSVSVTTSSRPLSE
jgi:hypothetical protein